MSAWEAAKAWRERYLEAMRRQLAIVEYIDTPGADLAGEVTAA